MTAFDRSAVLLASIWETRSLSVAWISWAAWAMAICRAWRASATPTAPPMTPPIRPAWTPSAMASLTGLPMTSRLFRNWSRPSSVSSPAAVAPRLRLNAARAASFGLAARPIMVVRTLSAFGMARIRPAVIVPASSALAPASPTPAPSSRSSA